MNVVEIVKRLAATNSRNEKEAIIAEAFTSGHREFFIASRLAYDVLITFGVKKVTEILEDDGVPGTFTFDDFLNLADKLRKRELTGHAARDAINAAASICDFETWNLFYRNVLMKDLSLGLTEGTINRVLTKLAKKNPEAEKFMVPVFECQLAENGNKPEHQKHMKGLKLLDEKMDGVRLLAFIDVEKRTVTHHFRDGKINSNFTEIRDAMIPLLDILPGSIVLDGEVIANSFQSLMTKVQKKGADTSDTKFALFDVISLSDFREGYCKVKQIDRHKILTEMEMSGMFASVTGGYLQVIPKVLIDLDSPEGKESFNAFNKQALANGVEGIMLKNPDAPYESKRSVSWLKIKPSISVTLEIVGFEQGDPEGKNKHRLGAFLCRGIDDGQEIVTKCGGGFTEEQRQEFWRDRDKLLGMMVEVKGDCLTLEAGSNIYSIRFPVFVGFRGTVPGEKL